MSEKPMLEATKEKVAMIADYASTFTSESGKRVLNDLKKSFCGDCLVPGMPDATAYNLGLRGAVLRIFEMLRLSELPIKVVDELTTETSIDKEV